MFLLAKDLISSRKIGNLHESRSTVREICYANPMVSRCHGVLFSFCAHYWYAFSSQIWLGTLGTIYKTTQMNPDEKREFYKSLRERINQLRMNHLFEEPCPLYEPEWDDDEEYEGEL